MRQGYWGNKEKTLEDFGATCLELEEPGDEKDAGECKTFLRTGDLGFLHRGELFICGRLKDLTCQCDMCPCPWRVRSAEISTPD